MAEEFNEDELRMLDEAAVACRSLMQSSIREESIQKAEEIYQRSPDMTIDEYDSAVSENILDISRSLGKSVVSVAKKMKDKAIESGDDYRARAVTRSQNSIGYLVRKGVDNTPVSKRDTNAKTRS